ncbi:uncharacterized protein LOC142334222 [Lycorma delicatula]|uniref:uncharacterized protein LOC142334222 n=1 Tax=Lycorma delicatula TaxID=130591 RepID=UPI003F50E1F9
MLVICLLNTRYTFKNFSVTFEMAVRMSIVGCRIVSLKGLISNCYSSSRGMHSVSSKVVTSSVSPQIHKFIPSLLLDDKRVSSVNNNIFQLSCTRLQILDKPMAIHKNMRIDLPVIKSNIRYEDRVPEKEIEEPKPHYQEEKHAVRMIVIRKRKMRIHKLKKLRKKMKFVRAKLRLKRKMLKEKLFNAELMTKIKAAEKFDPVLYASQKIKKANEVIIPKRWKGKRLPEFIIRDLIELKKNKMQKIKDKIERRKNMNTNASDYN